MDGIDFLWQQVTGQMADEMQLVDSRESFLEISSPGKNSSEQKSAPISCYCCGRPSGEWAVPFYQLRIDTYLRTDVPICAPCNTLFHGSYRYMGIEKGTPEKPLVPGKLGMLVGCGLLVTQQQNLLFTNPGWDRRLRVATQPLFELHQVSGKGAMEYACHLIAGLGEEAFPLLYISDIGRKKAELVANLKLTLSKAQIQVCSGESVFRINTALWQAIRDMQQVDNSGWKKLERFIVNSCHGRIAPNDEGLHAFLSTNPEALAIARRLPADPHEKLQLMRIV